MNFPLDYQQPFSVHSFSLSFGDGGRFPFRLLTQRRADGRVAYLVSIWMGWAHFCDDGIWRIGVAGTVDEIIEDVRSRVADWVWNLDECEVGEMQLVGKKRRSRLTRRKAVQLLSGRNGGSRAAALQLIRGARMGQCG